MAGPRSATPGPHPRQRSVRHLPTPITTLDSCRLSAHEQRSEMTRAVAEEEAAAAQRELEAAKLQATKHEAEVKAKADEVASKANKYSRPPLPVR